MLLPIQLLKLATSLESPNISILFLLSDSVELIFPNQKSVSAVSVHKTCKSTGEFGSIGPTSGEDCSF